MDQLQTRLEALEHQMHAVNRRLRRWQSLACGLLILALLTWALPLSTAQEAWTAEERARLASLLPALGELRRLLRYLTVTTDDAGRPEVRLTGTNLRIVNGLGSTDCFDENLNPIPDCPNGLGNLIVGYNEPFVLGENIRTGSHNVVVGEGHSFSRFGGLVVGRFNTISGALAVVSGGEFNTASGPGTVVSGGVSNTASGNNSVVSGGVSNTASDFAAVSGGEFNTASGFAAAVSGGASNTASGGWSTVSGGQSNTASGNFASVSGGGFNPLTEEGAGNTASGDLSSVSGGSGNTAGGAFSSASGGRNVTQETEFGWSAGSEADEVVGGNFRSP